MSTNALRAERHMGCSPIMTLRLLAMAEDAGESTEIEEPEQLMLPLEWGPPRLVVARPEPVPAPARPDPRQWGGRITLAAFEIMLGKRPAHQLSRLVDSRTLQQLALHTSRYGRERARLRPGQVPGRPRVTSVRSFQPHADAAEVTAVVHDGLRYRAVAIRLSARGDQWMTTAFQMG